MLATILLLGLVLVAALTDLRWHKIYNATTYPGILAALGLNAVGSLLRAASWVDEKQLRAIGWLPVTESFCGLLVCGLLMLACFVFFDVGGGDVKLIAMLGAFLGPQQGIEAMLWTFVLGGCAGLIVLIWRLGPVRLIATLLRQVLGILRLRRRTPLSEEERRELRSPTFLAPSALAAVVLVRFSFLIPNP
jgi:prepilin peptidase CpaA